MNRKPHLKLMCAHPIYQIRDFLVCLFSFCTVCGHANYRLATKQMTSFMHVCLSKSTLQFFIRINNHHLYTSCVLGLTNQIKCGLFMWISMIALQALIIFTKIESNYAARLISIGGKKKWMIFNMTGTNKLIDW